MREVLLWLAVACFGCAAALTPAEVADVAGTQTEISKCEDRALACKADGGTECYRGVYEPCMRDAGLLP